jgi:hypothetical protein
LAKTVDLQHLVSRQISAEMIIALKNVLDAATLIALNYVADMITLLVLSCLNLRMFAIYAQVEESAS